MKKSILAYSFLCLLLVGCNPRVITKVEKNLPARSADSVMIFMSGDPLPEECDTVGTIRVVDGGFASSSRCQFPQVLGLATQKTADQGGNALYIDLHRKPSVLGSSCHQISGTMLLLPSPLVSMSTAMAVQQAEIRRDEEMVGKVLRDLSRGFRPKNTLKFGIGPALIVSKIYTSNAVYKAKPALDLNVDYEHTWKNGLGLGINYYRSQSWFGDDGDMHVHYVGPSFVWAFREEKKWGAEFAYGLGYAYYKDKYHKGSGFGMMCKVGVEYLFSKHIGVGAELGYILTVFSKPGDIIMPENMGYGNRWLNLLVGPRFYF